MFLNKKSESLRRATTPSEETPFNFLHGDQGGCHPLYTCKYMFDF